MVGSIREMNRLVRVDMEGCSGWTESWMLENASHFIVKITAWTSSLSSFASFPCFLSCAPPVYSTVVFNCFLKALLVIRSASSLEVQINGGSAHQLPVGLIWKICFLSSEEMAHAPSVNSCVHFVFILNDYNSWVLFDARTGICFAVQGGFT